MISSQTTPAPGKEMKTKNGKIVVDAPSDVTYLLQFDCLSFFFNRKLEQPGRAGIELLERVGRRALELEL